MNDPQPEGHMASHIGRRKFLATLGGAAAWPLAARAQQPGKVPTIGFLGGATPAAQGQWAAAFVQRLRELGWIEGRTAAIEYRWAEGRSERAAENAAEFARRKVDVIVTSGTALIEAAKQATSVIPIVFAAAGDPVGTGLVASLARPGGNVTGLSLQQTETTGKRLELLRDSLCGSAGATRERFRAFAAHSLLACRPLRPRGVRSSTVPEQRCRHGLRRE